MTTVEDKNVICDLVERFNSMSTENYKLRKRIEELEEENKQLLERVRHSESERFNSYLHS